MASTLGEESKDEYQHHQPPSPSPSPSPRTMRRTWSSNSPTSDNGVAAASTPKCVCAPATHAGSFKCRLHRVNSHGHQSPPPPPPLTPPPAVSSSSTRTVEAQ